MHVNKYRPGVWIDMVLVLGLSKLFSPPFSPLLLGRWIGVNKMSGCQKLCWRIRFCVFLWRSSMPTGKPWLATWAEPREGDAHPWSCQDCRCERELAPGGGPALAQKNQVQFLQPGKVMLHMTSFSLCKLKDNLWVSRQELIGIILAAFDPRVLLQ